MVTTAIGRCSIAPAEERATAGVTTAEPWAGTTTPVAPAASALRQTAPRLRGSVTRSSTASSGRSAAASCVGVGVAVRLDPCDDALVVARAGELAQLALGAGAGLKPRRARAPRASARSVDEQLDHLAPAAQRLAHRTAPVDEVALTAAARAVAPPAVAHLPAGCLELAAQPVG